MLIYDAATLWIARHGSDGRPISSVARPRDGLCSRALIYRHAGQRESHNHRRRGVEPDCPNEYRCDDDRVVPMNETGGPSAGLIEIDKALCGELGAVLGSTTQRLRFGVVTDAPPRVRTLDALLCENQLPPISSSYLPIHGRRIVGGSSETDSGYNSLGR
jgi:hypothetical protein